MILIVKKKVVIIMKIVILIINLDAQRHGNAQRRRPVCLWLLKWFIGS